MKLDPNKWIGTLPKYNKESSTEASKLDDDKWLDTLPKKNKNSSIKKYSFFTILFVCGLILVSIIKNETRNLQKEIDELRASIDGIEFELHQTILDHEVITSPENISKLAKEYLDFDLNPYKKNQIKNLDLERKEKIIKETKKNNYKILLEKKGKKLSTKVKAKVAKKIEEKGNTLKKIYSDPQEVFTKERIHRWAGIQIVKLFFGIPIVPGK